MISKKNNNNTKKHSKKNNKIQKQSGGILSGEQIEQLGIMNNRNLDKYVLLSCPEFDHIVNFFIENKPEYFFKGNVTWNKYDDGTPKMFLDEFTVKMLKGRRVIYFGYFSFNEPKATNILSQYMFLSSLSSYGINQLNIVLPYYPTGTMERITKEGELGTGYYLAHIFNSIPSGAQKNELFVIDMHALCSRFFFHTNIKMTFITMFQQLLNTTKMIEGYSMVVFPDDGAAKRNSLLFKIENENRQKKAEVPLNTITCGKIRNEAERIIEITGDIEELLQFIQINVTKYRSDEAFIPVNLFIMDDLIQTGGTAGKTVDKLNNTIIEKAQITEKESIQLIQYKLFITHPIFPNKTEEPTTDSVRNILLNTLRMNKLPNLEFITTDTRPIMSTLLNKLNIEDSELKGRIKVQPINNILLNVFTDINTPFIVPFS